MSGANEHAARHAGRRPGRNNARPLDRAHRLRHRLQGDRAARLSPTTAAVAHDGPPRHGHAARHRHCQDRGARHRLRAERAGAGPARRRGGDPHRRARPRRRAVEGRGGPARASSPAASPPIPRSATARASPPRPELEAAFCGDPKRSVRIGCIRQDNSIPAMVRVDELLGKHLAILGTTGTGKSCTTALILRAILAKNPAAHIVLLDPHNEYATRLQRMGGGDQPAQHAAAVLALELRGDRRGPDLRRFAQGRDRDPAGADPHRQGPLQRRPRARRTCAAP